MKLTKAIELLLPPSEQASFLHSHDFLDALRLGIEALKAIRALRAGTSNLDLSSLPGETPDLPPKQSFTPSAPISKEHNK